MFLAPGVVPEGAAGAVAGTLTAADPDAGDTFTFTLVPGAGDNDQFTILGAELRTAAALDFEARAAYAAVVRVTDAGGLSHTQSLTVTATDVNEPPAITSGGGGPTAAASVAEGATVVTTVAAADPDAGASLTYSIAGGADAARFGLDPPTCVLRFLAPPDFEAPADANADDVYEVVVRVSNGSLSATQVLAVTVTNVAPAAAVAGAPAGGTEGTPITLGSAVTDPGTAGTVTYA